MTRPTHRARWLVATLLCLISAVSASPREYSLSKRVAPTCDASATTSICSPTSGQLWYNGTTQYVAWNTLQPAYVTNPQIDIYFYHIANLQYYPALSFHSIATTQGSLTVQIDDTWFVNLTTTGTDTTNTTFSMWVYIVPAGSINVTSMLQDPNLLSPKGVGFGLVGPAQEPGASAVSSSSGALVPSAIEFGPASSTSSASSSSSASNPSNNTEGHSDPQAWLIGVIVAVCVAAVFAAIATFFFVRAFRRRHVGGKCDVINPEGDPVAGGAMNEKGNATAMEHRSTTPMAETAGLVGAAAVTEPKSAYVHNRSDTFPSVSDRDFGSIRSNTPFIPSKNVSSQLPSNPNIGELGATGTSSNEALPSSSQTYTTLTRKLSASALSSTDAMLIADTFRQRMRKPTWNDDTRTYDNATQDTLTTDLDNEITSDEEDDDEGLGNVVRRVGSR
ncbi:hypothetical protein BZG36_00003 [Bifiguratus adelaidae]|uniref:Mid2 domain-containing protein n=1 Tax=Bifiguratus adelaidae TaxID=1938954 RepID=A0A261Y889_9FUNG|nr:hypothetical protein BZG36_00003 [Bifiguratus adelaidae]